MRTRSPLPAPAPHTTGSSRRNLDFPPEGTLATPPSCGPPSRAAFCRPAARLSSLNSPRPEPPPPGPRLDPEQPQPRSSSAALPHECRGFRVSSAPFITGNFDCEFKRSLRKKVPASPLVTCQVCLLQTSRKARVSCVINEPRDDNCKHIHTSEPYCLTFNLSTGKNLENKV